MITKFSNKKSTMLANKSATAIHTGIGINFYSKNQQLAEELHKLLIRKFKKCQVYSSFNGRPWGADLVDMQLISTYKEGI